MVWCSVVDRARMSPPPDAQRGSTAAEQAEDIYSMAERQMSSVKTEQETAPYRRVVLAVKMSAMGS